MDVEGAKRFLRENHRAVLATVRSDGSPQLSPVVAGIDSGGRAVISTRETAIKAHNVARTPSASLCVFQDSFFGRWLQIDGRADLLHLPDAMEGLVQLYRQVAGEHPDWEEFRAEMRRQRRLLLRVRIERAGPDVSG
jgi:PPOX class probable F420-dependent enzyme